MNSILKTTISINLSYNHCSMDSCSSLLLSLLVHKSKYWNTTRSQIHSACPCQVQIKLRMLSSWLCYHIKLTHIYQIKHWFISMQQMLPWSRIEYKFLCQNLWICHSPFTQKNTKFCISGSLSWLKTFKKPVMILMK